MDAQQKLRMTLARHGHRTTSPRERVYSILAQSSHPLSTAEIINRIENVDKVSVYRIVELFETIGIIHRVWNGFKSKVELSDSFSPHHHHFTCLSCGKMVSFKSNHMEQALFTIENNMGVDIEGHIVELSGRCEDCKTQSPTTPKDTARTSI